MAAFDRNAGFDPAETCSCLVLALVQLRVVSRCLRRAPGKYVSGLAQHYRHESSSQFMYVSMHASPQAHSLHICVHVLAPLLLAACAVHEHACELITVQGRAQVRARGTGSYIC